MGNCLTELQRLKWEAASAAAEIEEAQAEAEEPTDGQLQLQKVRSAIELAETDLRSNQEVLDNMGRQRDAAAVSATEYAKQAALVERLQVQLEALLSELKVMKELQAATTRLPLQAAKKRLAEVKSREKVVQQQLKQLQTQEEKLRKTALIERVMDRLLHQSLQIEQQQLPFQIQLHENQVLLKLFEDELQKRQGAEAAKANAQEVNSKED